MQQGILSASVFPRPEEWAASAHLRPTPGETALFHFLATRLDVSYEVFLQPRVNGDQPDIVLLRQGGGCILFEVKDWDLDCYQYQPGRNTWRVSDCRGNSGDVLSPLAQVKQYKDHFFQYHIEGLMGKKETCSNYYSIIACVVYFHCASEGRVRQFLGEGVWKKETEHVTVWGSDSLNEEKLQSLLHRSYLARRSRYFSDDLYWQLRRTLQPPFHSSAEGKEFVLDAKQTRLAQSLAGKKTKICGVAGSGKTLVLARRAVAAAKRTGGRVLVLTFNITLRNYIHDRISEVREDFSWESFEILHYHLFISTYRNRHGLVPPVLQRAESHPGGQDGQRSDSTFWELQEAEIPTRYDVILVDEVQDFERAWVETIHRLLEPGGELVFFGDERQNIYRRLLDVDRRPFTKLGGAWNKLQESKRVNTTIGDLAMRFFGQFLRGRYLQEHYEFQADLFATPVIKFYRRPSLPVGELEEIILSFLQRHQIHDEDGCVLASKVEYLRLLDTAMRRRNMRTVTTFESQEEYDSILAGRDKSGPAETKDKCERIRRSKKFHFWAGSGGFKLSTIHSFKGWESHTLFLVLTGDGTADDPAEKVSDELIYTALTRTRQNLIILSVGENKYNEFLCRQGDLQEQDGLA